YSHSRAYIIPPCHSALNSIVNGSLVPMAPEDNRLKSSSFHKFDPRRVPSPCYVVDVAAVETNLRILHRVQQESGAKVLAALKAFSLWRLGELTGRYLSGTCASGLHEALLARDE